jgi:hypothetical protein
MPKFEVYTGAEARKLWETPGIALEVYDHERGGWVKATFELDSEMHRVAVDELMTWQRVKERVRDGYADPSEFEARRRGSSSWVPVSPGFWYREFVEPVSEEFDYRWKGQRFLTWDEVKAEVARGVSRDCFEAQSPELPGWFTVGGAFWSMEHDHIQSARFTFRRKQS